MEISEREINLCTHKIHFYIRVMPFFCDVNNVDVGSGIKYDSLVPPLKLFQYVEQSCESKRESDILWGVSTNDTPKSLCMCYRLAVRIQSSRPLL